MGIIVSGISAGPPFYSTNFNLNENVISENGKWISGLHLENEAAMKTSGGLVYGTQDGSEGDRGLYNDSHAFLSANFPANQRASAVIFYDGSDFSNKGILEIELLLRMSDGALSTGLPYGQTTEYGYEINLGLGSLGIYIQIGRWKRDNLFNSQGVGSPVTTMGIHNGDIFSADIVGNNITVRLNSTIIATAVDDPSWLPRIGSPGIGQYRTDRSSTPLDPSAYCFTSFTGSGL
jgi:hypothetical protein